MLQLDRIKEAENLLSQVWQEMEQGYIDEDWDLLQEAVYCQVNINRIVYKLNIELEKQIREEGKNATDQHI